MLDLLSARRKGIVQVSRSDGNIFHGIIALIVERQYPSRDPLPSITTLIELEANIEVCSFQLNVSL